MTTTITLELNDTQCAALLAMLHARPNMSGTVEQQLSYKVQNAIRDAERARALLRGEYRLTQGKALPVRDKA